MKLFTNGCSFTWGGAIYPSLYDDFGRALEYDNSTEQNKKRLSEVWPHHLGKHLNASKVVNLSLGCGSNDRILRTTFDYFAPLICQENFDNDWVAVVQWSMIHRFEYYDESTQSWAMCLPNGSMTTVYCDPRHRQIVDRFKDIVLMNLNDHTHLQKYWTQVVSLASFFENLGIKYWFTNLDTDLLRNLSSEQSQYIEKRISWLYDNPYKKFGNLFSDAHDSGSGHPSIFGHQQIADNINNFIKDRL